MKSSISLTINSSLRQAMLKLMSFITKWREIILDISLNIPQELNTIKLEIMLIKPIKAPLKKQKKILKLPTQSDSALPLTIQFSTMRLKTTQAKLANLLNKPLMMLLLILIKSNKINTKMPLLSCNWLEITWLSGLPNLKKMIANEVDDSYILYIKPLFPIRQLKLLNKN